MAAPTWLCRLVVAPCMGQYGSISALAHAELIPDSTDNFTAILVAKWIHVFCLCGRRRKGSAGWHPLDG